MKKNHTYYDNTYQNTLSLEIIGSILGGIIVMCCIGCFVTTWYNNWKVMRRIEKTGVVYLNDIICKDKNNTI